MHEDAQLGVIDDLPGGVERVIVDLADDAELAEPPDAHAVGFRQGAEPGRLLGDLTDPDQRHVHRLCRLVDPPDLGIAQEPPPLALDLAQRDQVLDGEGVGRHVRPILGGHHADQRVR